MSDNNKQYLPKLHSDILSIMDEIDKLCRSNNLHYYLIGGTLLGAVRHRGFIPWDDDLDIVMPRSDMEKLLYLVSNDSNTNLKVEWITTNPKYGNIFSKICLNDTIFDEAIWEYPFGIFVDIFPLDLTGMYNKKLGKIKKRIQRFHYISSAKNSTGKVSNFKQLFYSVASLFISNKSCYKYQIKTALSASKFGQTHYANFGSQYSIKKQTMPIEWYGEGTELDFEGRMYKVPSEYLKVVQSIFGPNYMQLPPENKRRCHYPVRVKFSDGTEMTFEKPKHRVTIDEQ